MITMIYERKDMKKKWYHFHSFKLAYLVGRNEYHTCTCGAVKIKVYHNDIYAPIPQHLLDDYVQTYYK